MSDPKEYTVGWICAVEVEYVAAQEFLDEEHPPLDFKDANDNIYTLGSIGQHRVVVACLSLDNYGLVSAANVAKDMLRTFTNIRFGLMVGIGGGVPTTHDIRLGDIVVSSLDGENGAVFQYDYGKAVQNHAFKQTQHQDAPPVLLQAAAQNLKVKHRRKGNQIDEAVTAVLDGNPRLQEYRRPDPSTDLLYRSDFVHVETPNEGCALSCGLDDAKLIIRGPRNEYDDNPKVHYGLIASGNQLIKDAILRDRLAREKGVLCFEMEAAGLMNHFKCLVIRGICDYSDSHKNESWQGYAAMAAAAYAKDLLNTIAPNKVEAEKKMNEVLSDVQEDVKQTRTGVESLKEDNHSRQIRGWLSPPDPSTNFNRALSLRHEGTGSWFLQSREYSEWKTKKDSFLWLNGIPGCGKTVLSSTVIEDLERGKEASPHVLSFYFDFNETKKQSLEFALRSLINQIYNFSKAENIRKYIDTLYSSCEDSGHQADTRSLQKAFMEMTEQLNEVWIVLDALDECGTRQNSGLFEWIYSLHGLQTNTHILVTSRPEQDIESAIEKWARAEDIIQLQSRVIGNDIRGYIKERIINSRELERWQSRPEVQDEIEETLVQKADGMFRWVACQLDILEKCLNYQAVHKTLISLPTTLDETYERIIASVPTMYKHETTRCLQFLAYTDRPLRVNELVDAIAVDVGGQPAFDPRNRMPEPKEIASYCSSLVLVEEKMERAWDSETKDYIQQYVRLAHYSVKEYLTSNRLNNDIAKYLSETNARTSIAEVCLTYLIHLDPAILYKYKDRSVMLHSYPLIAYAAFRGLNNAGLYFGSPPLFYASSLGLVHTVETLINDGNDIDFYVEGHGTALRSAVLYGHDEVCQILLDNGADMNAKGAGINVDGEHQCVPLHDAAQGGDENIVTKLLDGGADINSQNENCETALMAASRCGHENIVDILLKRGADLECGKTETALVIAAKYGYGNIVKILLDWGADINGLIKILGEAGAEEPILGPVDEVSRKRKREADSETDSCWEEGDSDE
ncbi:hypothetical protein F5Y13DRAFT_178439 [Hypoxylon sp. FL1857]|nr:hypothetical protein F5Y13DRAFT_178439 [Hypoxylon sp. FL1857]